MHPEAGLATQRVAQGGGQLAVAVVHGEWLGLGERERVRAGAGEPHPELGARADDSCAQVAELFLGGRDRLLRRGGQFDLALHQLPLDAPVGDRSHQWLDARCQAAVIGVDQHQLLFDAERVLGTRAEAVLVNRHRLFELSAHISMIRRRPVRDIREGRVAELRETR